MTHRDCGLPLRWRVTIVVVLAGVSSSRILGDELLQPECQPITKDTLQQVLGYAKQKYGVTPQSAQVVHDVVLGDTCYAKLLLQLSDRAPISLYLSPDRRFAFTNVFDLKKNPADEDRIRRNALNEELSAGDHPVLGQAGAPVTIVLFSEFQCPYCKNAATILKDEVLPSTSGSVRLVFRHYPLPMHNWALTAARAGVCVAEQGPNGLLGIA